eukprot:Sspe_Gene.119193::Locus_114482_Transcript_1_1_Confidence_1.000_Length_462::g.119193::m.119193
MGFAHIVSRCFGPLLRYLAREDDTKDDTIRKALLVPYACVTFPLVLCANFASIAQGRIFAGTYGLVLSAFPNVVFLAYVLSTKRCPQQAAGIFATTVGLALLVS